MAKTDVVEGDDIRDELVNGSAGSKRIASVSSLKERVNQEGTLCCFSRDLVLS